jgi:tetratricopeptide (TPR) repeat protein
MPPQVHHRWAPSVREEFAAMNQQLELGDLAGVSARCERITAFLQQMAVGSPDPSTRRQVAYSYFDLTYYFQRLGRTADAKWGYEQARNCWAAESPDFEALAQLAGCHNHLGLIALDSGDLPTADTAFSAAIAARQAAGRAHPNHRDHNSGQISLTDEQAENLVYLAGVICNLGTLHRQTGDKTKAAQQYERAIEYLTALLPPEREPLDEEILDLHMNMWRQIYGTPHWVRLARQFLDNAKGGLAAVTEA